MGTRTDITNDINAKTMKFHSLEVLQAKGFLKGSHENDGVLFKDPFL